MEYATLTKIIIISIILKFCKKSIPFVSAGKTKKAA